MPEHDHHAIRGTASAVYGRVFSDIGTFRSSTIRGRNTCSSEGLSLPAAMNKQLGLKLKLQKRPMQVLVIDHVETPVDN